MMQPGSLNSPEHGESDGMPGARLDLPVRPCHLACMRDKPLRQRRSNMHVCSQRCEVVSQLEIGLASN